MYLLAALLLAAPPLPRCLVMVAEQNLGHSSYWWAKGTGADLSIVENAMVESLRQRGVSFIDHDQLTALMKTSAGLGKDAPSDSEVKQFAGTAGADVVFVGKAIATDAGPILGTQMRSLQANVSVRLLNLDDAKIIGTASRTETVVNVDAVTGTNKALAQAGAKIAAELYDKLAAAWQNRTGVRLTVSGLKSWNELHALEDALRKTSGISAVNERRYDAGTAELELDTALAASAIAERLSEKIAKLTLSVDTVSANTVHASRH
jgi:hypothetical protein